MFDFHQYNPGATRNILFWAVIGALWFLHHDLMVLSLSFSFWKAPMDSGEYILHHSFVVIVTAIESSEAAIWPLKTLASVGTSSQSATGDSLINCDAPACYGSPVSHFPLARSSALFPSKGQDQTTSKILFAGLFPGTNPGTNSVSESNQEIETTSNLNRKNSHK